MQYNLLPVKKEMIEMYSKIPKPSITDVADHFKVSRSAKTAAKHILELRKYFSQTN